MSDIEAVDTDLPRMALSAILDTTEVADMKQELLAAAQAGGGLDVDASAVQRISSLCLQLLVSAKQSFAASGKAKLQIVNPSENFTQTASALALADALDIKRVSNG